MKNELLKAIKTDSLIEIYKDIEDMDTFIVAKVLKVTDNHAIIVKVSATGMYDGFHLIEIEDIYQINTGSKYIRNIEKLYVAKNQKHIEFDEENENLMLSILKFAKKNNFAVSVELFKDGDVQGFIKDISEDILIISTLTNDGELDGEAIVKLEDVTSISCDHEDAVCLKILYSYLENKNISRKQ